MNQKKHIALMMGSYNPIHLGHLQIAVRCYESKIFDEIWLVISPANPHKDKKLLAEENHRLTMVNLALQPLPYPIKSCDIEFQLPQPSYTINTLNELKLTYPYYTFSLVLGEDNLERLYEWKNIDSILKNYKIYIYNRNGKSQIKVPENITYLEMPMLDISSTEIRNRIQQQKPIDYFVTKEVKDYILIQQLYS